MYKWQIRWTDIICFWLLKYFFQKEQSKKCKHIRHIRKRNMNVKFIVCVMYEVFWINRHISFHSTEKKHTCKLRVKNIRTDINVDELPYKIDGDWLLSMSNWQIFFCIKHIRNCFRWTEVGLLWNVGTFRARNNMYI